MIEKITTGQYPHDGVERQCIVEISPTMDGIKLEKTHLTSYGGDVYALICIPSTYALVIDADRLAANARIKDLQAQVAEMPILDPNQQVVFESEDGAQIIERDIDGQFWISEPWNDDDPGYPLSVPLPKGLTIITFALGTVVGESHDTHSTPNQ